MANINITLDDAQAFILAQAKGWTPTIEDTNQPMVGDEYPQVANPQTHIEFLEVLIPVFIGEYVMNEGRKSVSANLDSMYDAIKHDVDNGEYDAQIMTGDLDSIKGAIRDSIV